MSQSSPERKSQRQDNSVKGNTAGHDFIFAPQQIDTYIETQIVEISVDKITQQPLIKTSPYKGLKRFNLRDREYFFGRDALIAKLFKAVNKSNFSLVLGASGSGKSSVVRAGLIPELKKSLESQKFYDFIFTPNQDPFESLYRCLLSEEKDYRFSESDVDFVREGKPNTLPQLISKLNKNEERWFIFIDQFEQLFINTDSEKRNNFIQGIVQVAAEEDSSVRIVLAMRSDFLEQFSYYSALGDIANKNNIHLVTEMYPDELRQAIEQPAAKNGVVFEKGLVEQIIKEVEGQKGYLPLLQYTLDLLWEKECTTKAADGLFHIEDRTLNKESYVALEGVRGALQKRVDEIYTDICKKNKDGELVIKQIFLRLVNIVESESGSRAVSRRAYYDKFVGQAVKNTLNRFINENLLVSNYEYSTEEKLSVRTIKNTKKDTENRTNATIEIAHEILLSSWDKLKHWLEEEKETIILKNWLADETIRWLKVGVNDKSKASDELLKGSRLDQIVELREENAFKKFGGLNKDENKFIDTSIELRNKQRRNQILVISISSALFIGLLGIGGVANWQSRMAESRQFASDAVSRMRTDPEGSLPLATKAMDKYHTPEAENALRKALFESRIRAKIQIPQHRHDNPTWMVAFSSDSQYVVATNKKKGTVKVLNINTEDLDNRISSVKGKAFTNGNFVLTVSNDGKIHVWDVIKGGVIGASSHNLKKVTSAALSPDGKFVFISSGKNPGQIWNVDTNEVKNLNKSVGNVEKAVFSPKNKFLVTVIRPDWKAQLWNVKTGSFIQDLPGHISKRKSLGQVTIAKFSSDGNYIATTCGFGQPLGCYSAPVKRDINGDGIPEVVGGYDLKGDGIAEFDGTVRIWKRFGDTFEVFQELPINNRTYGLAFDPKSKLIATASGDQLSRVWKFSTKELIYTFTNHTNWAWSADFNLDSNFVITTGSKDGTARMWETKTGRELLVLRGHERFAESAAFSPNDKFVLTIDDVGIARVWNINAGRHAKLSEQAYLKNGAKIERRIQIIDKLQPSATKRLLQNSTEKWNAGVFSRDRKLLVTFNTREQSYTTAQVWSTDIGKLILPLRNYKDGVRYATFSNDNKFVVLADGFGNTARVWEISTGRKIDLIGHIGRVANAAFSPNNACVVTGSDHGKNGTVRVWNTTTGEMMTILWGHTKGVRKVAFDPSSKSVITLGKDNKTKIYSSEGCVSVKDLRTLARNYIKKNTRKY